MIRSAKNTYYIDCFNNSMHDIRKSWKKIKIFFGSVSHKDKIEKIIVADQIFTEPLDIANKFNDYFQIQIQIFIAENI